MTRIVLVGGGYVTIHAYAAIARRLRRRLARGEVEVVVVTADPCHSFHGFTGEVLAGILPFERTRTPVAEACPLARVVHARVTGVDRGRHTVTYVPADGRPGRRPALGPPRHRHGLARARRPRPRAVAARVTCCGHPGDIERLSARVAAAATGSGRPGPDGRRRRRRRRGGRAGGGGRRPWPGPGPGGARPLRRHARARARRRPAPAGPAGDAPSSTGSASSCTGTPGSSR